MDTRTHTAIPLSPVTEEAAPANPVFQSFELTVGLRRDFDDAAVLAILTEYTRASEEDAGVTDFTFRMTTHDSVWGGRYGRSAKTAIITTIHNASKYSDEQALADIKKVQTTLVAKSKNTAVPLYTRPYVFDSWN